MCAVYDPYIGGAELKHVLSELICHISVTGNSRVYWASVHIIIYFIF